MKQFPLLMSILLIAIVSSNCKHNNPNKDASSNKTIYGLIAHGDSLNVYMQLIPSSIMMSKDSLYFNYRIINDSPKDLFIYQFEYLNTILDSVPKSGYPMCDIYLMDKENKLPSDEVVSIGGKDVWFYWSYR